MSSISADDEIMKTFCLGAILGVDIAIPIQEKQGQQTFVNSTTLPRKMDSEAKETLEQAGVKFLGNVEEDRLFQKVELPSGWKKVETSHSMWTNLVDDKGRERASIFYKAAFYDRDSFLHISRRFNIKKNYDLQETHNVIVVEVKDSDKTIYSTPAVVIQEGGFESEIAEDQAYKGAENWLIEKYPNWKDPKSYWEI